MIINLDFVFVHESDSATLLSGNITLNSCPISSQELFEWFDKTIFNAQQISAWATDVLTIIESNKLTDTTNKNTDNKITDTANTMSRQMTITRVSKGADKSVLSLLLK